MPRVFVKTVTQYLEALKYHLVIYYHKDLSIKDIYNRMIEREEGLEKYEPATEDTDDSLVIVDTKGTAYLVINSQTSSGVILHEVIHIMTAIFEFIGSQHTEETDELYAYNAQYIYEFIVKTMINKWKVSPQNLLNFN